MWACGSTTRKVNNFDFWNNSEAIKPENRAKMGTIVFDKTALDQERAEAGAS